MLYQKIILSGCVIALGALSACSQDHPGNISMKRLEVHQEQHSQQVLSHDLKQADLEAIARDYNKYGKRDPLTVMVQYDPVSTQNTAMNATHHATKIAKGLRKAGVDVVKTEIMPVKDVGDHSKTLIAYDKYTAAAPEDCGVMPGMDNTKTDWKAVEEYGFGCSVEAKIAKQIARPADLLGNAGLDDDNDARRAYKSLVGYRQGVPNEPLQGEQASED